MWTSPEIELPGEWPGCAVRVLPAANGPSDVTVYFRLDRGDAFTTGLSRRLKLASSGRPSVARLSFPHTSRRVQLRIEVEGAGGGAAGVSIVALTQACRF